jgi:ubiquinone/menaquinone biosynthesis C-methylase UbiE
MTKNKHHDFAEEYVFWSRTFPCRRYYSLLALVGDDAPKALNAGCGEGSLAAELAQRISHVVPVDVPRAMLSLAQKRHCEEPDTGRAHLVRAGVESLPFEESTFDLLARTSVVHTTSADDSVPSPGPSSC